MLAIYSWHTQQWYFYALRCDSLYTEEATDQVLSGLGPTITALEQGASDLGVPITMVLEPATRAFQSVFRRKRFDYLRVDAEIPTGEALCELLIDDVVVQRLVLQGARTRRLRRLGGREGVTWRVRLTYTGVGPASFNGVEMQAVVLEAR
jgi:hypothetical protein